MRVTNRGKSTVYLYTGRDEEKNIDFVVAILPNETKEIVSSSDVYAWTISGEVADIVVETK